MPASLREEGDKLVLKLGGDRTEFQDQLAKAKAVAGRRYNPEDKVWEFPNDLDTLLKVVFTIEPELPSELRERIREARAKVAEELVTKLPDDAALSIPWHDRLAPKQRAGVDFLAEHPHSMLADEMGSGKTVQAISTVYEYLLRNEEGAAGRRVRALVIAPNSVLGHWRREIEKWTGVSDSVTVVDAKTKEKRAEQVAEATGWVIVNWEKLQNRVGLAQILADRRWDGIILDESHRAKNRKAQQTKAIWKLKAPVQLALSGTPVMNDPGELWPILKWLRPEQYTSYWAFFYNYTDYYEGYKGKPVVVGVKNADALRFELSDKMVRRTKRDIHADIPEPFDPIENTLAMKPKQRKLYEEALQAFWLEVAEEASEWDDEDKQQRLLAAAEGGNMNVIKTLIPNAASRLTRCRQVATSPALLGGPDESGKLDAVIETVTDAEPGRPFVIFAWYKPTVELILNRLLAHDISCKSFTGDTPKDDRVSIANAFQNEEFQVIVPTIAVGGMGIDLFRASDVLLAEQDWTPAINQQAIDRVDRKGQTLRVQAQFFRSEGTVDTGKIAPKNRLKSLITSSILGEK